MASSVAQQSPSSGALAVKRRSATFEDAQRAPRVWRQLAGCSWIAPLAVVAAYSLLWFIPSTRALMAMDEEQRELHPIELATFGLFMLGAALGVMLAGRAHRLLRDGLVTGFFALFAAGLFFIGMEEVAWGQWLLGFGTPEPLREVNAQGETTVHNIVGLQGRSELLRMAYGAGGAFGVLLGRWARLRAVTPPVALLPWFLVILVFAAGDLAVDYTPFHGGVVDDWLDNLTEVVELLVAGSALLFVVGKRTEVGGGTTLR